MAFAITTMEMVSGKNKVFGITTQSCNNICHLKTMFCCIAFKVMKLLYVTLAWVNTFGWTGLTMMNM